MQMILGGTQKECLHFASFTFILMLCQKKKKIELACDFMLVSSPISFLGIVFLTLNPSDILGHIILHCRGAVHCLTVCTISGVHPPDARSNLPTPR